jgi:predicted small lipoprotein YifL
MANSKKRKAAMVSILIVVLLTAVASFLAQTGRKDPVPSPPASSAIPEKQKEASARDKLTGLFSSVGIQVGPALQTSNAHSYRELRLNWDSLQKTGSAGLFKAEQLPVAGVLTQISSSPRAGGLPRERSMELSPDHILIVALDENEAVRWWKLMIDPRLVRAEVGRSDDMRSENLYQAKVDFIVECPDDPLLKQLRFFRPVWNGESFHLEPWGVAPLRRE